MVCIIWRDPIIFQTKSQIDPLILNEKPHPITENQI